MISADEYWISEYHRFDEIKNKYNVVSFNWSYNYADDYISLSESFYHAAQLLMINITDDYRNNTKCDQWFFPALYLYRQAIELLCKGLLFTVIPKKELCKLFTTYKHNISGIFSEYIKHSTKLNLEIDEYEWVLAYLKDVEEKDAKSNLFRYPIRDGCLSQYHHHFLDIVDMTNSIDQCYSLLYKCVDNDKNPFKYSNDINLDLSPQVIFFASHGIGNCMLYNSVWDNAYMDHIEGYSEVAYYLKNFSNRNHLSFLPIVFLIRHAIELSLKSIMSSHTEYKSINQIKYNKLRSHNVYKDLWGSVKSEIVDIADSYLKELGSLDKKGDAFRYPTNYGLQYHFKEQKYDYEHSIDWLLSIFKFIIGCSYMVDAVLEYEMENRFNSNPY